MKVTDRRKSQEPRVTALVALKRAWHVSRHFPGKRRPEAQATEGSRAPRSGIVGPRPPRGALFLPPPHPRQPTPAPLAAGPFGRRQTPLGGSSPLTKSSTPAKHPMLQRHPFPAGWLPSELLDAFDRNGWMESSGPAYHLAKCCARCSSLAGQILGFQADGLRTCARISE